MGQLQVIILWDVIFTRREMVFHRMLIIFDIVCVTEMASWRPGGAGAELLILHCAHSTLRVPVPMLQHS